jgi:hypothetical protein
MSSTSTTALASIFAPSEPFVKRPPPENSSLNRTRRCQRRSAPLVPLPLFLLLVRLRLRASVLSALRPGRDEQTPDRASRAGPARRARRARRARPPRALVRLRPRARPVPPPCRRSLQPPRACALLSLNARCPALRAAWRALVLRARARCRPHSAERPRAERRRAQLTAAPHGCAALNERLQQPARRAARLVVCAPAALGRAGAVEGYDFKGQWRQISNQGYQLILATNPRAVTSRASRSRMRSCFGAPSWRRRPAAAAPGAARPRRAAAGRRPPSRDRPARVTGVEVVGHVGVHKLVAERQHGGAGGENGQDDENVDQELTRLAPVRWRPTWRP